MAHDLCEIGVVDAGGSQVSHVTVAALVRANVWPEASWVGFQTSR
jgi:hypothetical protein